MSALKRLPPRQSKFGNRARLNFEMLEDRANPVSVNVTSLMDSGAGTLRDAIVQVNGSTDPSNTINITAQGVISLQSALPSIQKYVDIVGTGSATTIVERAVGASTTFRVFNIVLGSHVSITGVTVTKGNGGIAADGRLTMTDSKVTDCQTTFDGGGIALNGNSKLFLNSTVIHGNSADGNGGGIYLVGATEEFDSMYERVLIDGNSEITLNTCEGYGGGIYVGKPGVGKTDYIRIHASSINQNSAKFEGGGLYFQTVTTAAAVDAAITNCDIIENRSRERNGGGIYTGAKLFVSESTIDGNKGALLAGYAIAVDASVVSQPLELSGCSVSSSLHIPVGGGAADPNSSAIDTGAGTIKFTACVVARNDGHGVSGTVVSGGGNRVDNSLTTSTGWLPPPLDRVF